MPIFGNTIQIIISDFQNISDGCPVLKIISFSVFARKVRVWHFLLHGAFLLVLLSLHFKFYLCNNVY